MRKYYYIGLSPSSVTYTSTVSPARDTQNFSFLIYKNADYNPALGNSQTC